MAQKELLRPQDSAGHFQKAGDKYFRTFEFALFPFVPFSKAWNTVMNETSGREGDFAWGPSGFAGQGKIPKYEGSPWEEEIRTYNQARGNKGPDLATSLDNVPQQELQKASQRLSKELAWVLSNKQGYSPPSVRDYEGHTDRPEKFTVETIETIMTEMGITPKNQGKENWKVRGTDGKVLKLVRQTWAKNSRDSAGEQLDFMVKEGEGQARRLEYILHRIGAHAGPEFVKDVMGVEATILTSQKYLEQQIADTDSSKGLKDQFATASRNMANDVARQYNLLSTMFNELYGKQSLDKILDNTKSNPNTANIRKMIKLSSMTKDDAKFLRDSLKDYGAADESLWYITRQFLDRFVEIRNYDMAHASDGIGSFIYQVPLQARSASPKWMQGYTIGFAKFSPNWVRGRKNLKYVGGQPEVSINVETVVIDMLVDDAGQVREEWMGPKGKGLQDIMVDVGTGAFRGIMDNFLLWDYATKIGNEVKAGVMRRDIENTMLYAEDMGAHGRQFMIGSSMYSQIDDMSFGATDQMGTVVGIQTLTTREIASSIKEQFEHTFIKKNSKTAKDFNAALLKVFERGAEEANLATDAWKEEIPDVGSYSLPGGNPGVFAKAGGDGLWKNMEDPLRGGRGIGVPFTFISGRRGTSTAAKKFKKAHANMFVQSNWLGPEGEGPSREWNAEGDLFGPAGKVYKGQEMVKDASIMDWRLTINTSGKTSIRFFKGEQAYKYDDSMNKWVKV